MQTNNKNNRKISIIGAGFVGSSIAYSLMIKNLATEIVLIDVKTDIAESEALDIRHGIPYMGSCNIFAGNYSDIANSDLIIVTAGRNRKPNETRLDLAYDNLKIAKEVSNNIKKYYTGGVVLVVSNPVDIITTKLVEWLGLPKGMVFGTGCILDSSRFVTCISNYLGISSEVVNAQIIGEHGASQIAMWSKVTIAGIPIDEYCKSVDIRFDEQIKEKIENSVVETGTAIIKGKGRTHYGIATCVCYITDSIINNRPTIISASTMLYGEFGISDIALSVPCIISATGIQKVLVDYLNSNEYDKLMNSASILQMKIQELDK